MKSSRPLESTVMTIPFAPHPAGAGGSNSSPTFALVSRMGASSSDQATLCFRCHRVPHLGPGIDLRELEV